MDTIRETIIQDFLSRLAVITTANGYNTNIGAKVLRAQKGVDPGDLPISDLWPGAEKGEDIYGQTDCKMQMKIEGIAKRTLVGSPPALENASVIAEKILGDLKKCILAQYDTTTSPPTGWNRSAYIDSLVYTGGGTDEYPDESMQTAGAYITVDVTYHTKKGDPYTQ
ncbi:MAG: hypothetical protein ABFD75_12515 [Smithella sp.]